MLSPKMAHIRPFKVVAKLPEQLEPLRELAQNLWWTWHPEAVELWLRLDRSLWSEVKHNPVRMLGALPQSRLEEVAKDDGFLTSMNRVMENLKRHMDRTPWHNKTGKRTKPFTLAYFCTEFGLTECLQVYSGGLGCLAGDHLKSASELGLPLVGVGMLYRFGYFQQYLNADGWQQEYYPDLDFANLPIEKVRDDSGKQIRVKVHLPGRELTIAVWRVKVGRIDLYLLDTNLSENDVADRGITGQLYGGDMETRIKQEIVLGIGGVRALEAVGIEPDVFHMNEGHSAFLALERIRKIIEHHHCTFDEARKTAAAANVFTTHTPVPAGIDRFPPDMIQRYFKDYHGSLHLDMEGLLALGRENVYAKNEFFSMAVLALRTADWYNGVSQLHGEVSRNMWQNIWPNVPEGEVRITHVTNGIHARSWLSGDLINLLDRYLGARWQDNPVDQSVWEAIKEVPDEELWRVHERRRQNLIVWCRRRLRRQLEARGAHPDAVAAAAEALSPSALTIGFARRFATYKRGNLILRDKDRLIELLSDAQRPVQFLIAGKAHPADGGGKEFIRQLVHFARESNIARDRIVFLENYDIQVARYLVQGCDVWLNTPKRGMEASGTSGMKAAVNGGLNCSILDGWWDEAYESDLGWAIGRGETYADPEMQDDIESRALYDLFEQQILPLFYDRDANGIPRGWVGRMKQCIAVLAPKFNTNRMVQDYSEKLYLPALDRAERLNANNMELGKKLAHQSHNLRANWSKLHIVNVEADTSKALGLQDQLEIAADVDLGELKPEDLRVQAYHGMLDNDGNIIEGESVDLAHQSNKEGNVHRFSGSLKVATSGRHGFSIRIVPGGDLYQDIHEPGLILWESAAQDKSESRKSTQALAG